MLTGETYDREGVHGDVKKQNSGKKLHLGYYWNEKKEIRL